MLTLPRITKSPLNVDTTIFKFVYLFLGILLLFDLCHFYISELFVTIVENKEEPLMLDKIFSGRFWPVFVGCVSDWSLKTVQAPKSMQTLFWSAFLSLYCFKKIPVNYIHLNR